MQQDRIRKAQAHNKRNTIFSGRGNGMRDSDEVSMMSNLAKSALFGWLQNKTLHYQGQVSFKVYQVTIQWKLKRKKKVNL